MKSFKVKALALAVFGLAGLGMVGAASAACPFPFNTPTGAWSAQVTNQGTLAAGTPGLELTTPSACKMTAFLNAGASPLATAAVADTSPNNEPSYHFRFYIDTTALGKLPAGLTSVQIFAVNAANTFPTSGNAATQAMLRIGLSGTGTTTNPNLVAVYSCNVPAQSYVCVGAKPLAPGVHWIEGHLTNGASGIANIWIDKASIASDTSPAADIAISGDNAGWTGAKVAALGLGGASPNFRTAVGTGSTHAVGFDAFDSRRQTFIGQ